MTASTVYHCNSAILTGISGDYPQNGTDYVIFSNEEAVRAKAAELKKQKESGNPVDAEEIISQLANIIVCLQSGGYPECGDFCGRQSDRK